MCQGPGAGRVSLLCVWAMVRQEGRSTLGEVEGKRQEPMGFTKALSACVGDWVGGNENQN